MRPFIDFWNAHPTIVSMKTKVIADDYPCDRKAFDNQCAIRIGACLKSVGFSTAGYKGRLCYPHYSKYLKAHKGEQHVLAAQDFADWLETGTTELGKPKKFTSPADALKGLTKESRGLLFFLDCFNRPGQSFARRSGDHIDLFDGTEITAAHHLNAPAVFPFASATGQAREVWYWHIP